MDQLELYSNDINIVKLNKITKSTKIHLMKSNDQEDDEGFIPALLQINSEHDQKSNQDEQFETKPIDFQPRFIIGDGILRKQPQQMEIRFRRYLESGINEDIEGSALTNTENKQISEQYYGKLKPMKQKNQKQQDQNNKKTLKRTPPTKYMSKFIEEKDYLYQQSHSKNSKSSTSININIDHSQIPKHPYNAYIASDDYILVYSRNRDQVQTITPFSDEFSANEINLSKVLTEYHGDHYGVLKKFQHFPLLQQKYKNSEYRPGFQIHHEYHQKQKKKQQKPNFIIHQTVSAQTNYNSKTQTQHRQHPNHSYHIPITNNYHFPHISAPSPYDQLQFDSRFQCGNLLYTYKNKSIPNNYTLFLQNDTNSNGYNQWFCFSVRKMKISTWYHFQIVNLRKRHSLVKSGMKITAFSMIDAQNNNGNGWTKIGSNIKYEKSTIKKYSDPKFKFYSLSFSIQFRHENDYVCLAMNTPYSYTRLIHHMKICSEIANQKYNSSLVSVSSQLDGKKEQIWQNSIVGYSLSNNSVPYIKISVPEEDGDFLEEQPENREGDQNSVIKLSTEQRSRKTIVILARQHPGQTLSSFMMEEILYLLAENTNESVNWLLKTYTFKIFPMINVDGVIYGNFRCDLGGFDLNRNWKNPDRYLHPQIFAIKEELEKIHNQNGIECLIDLHGHSKKLNTFAYSCENDPVSARVLSLVISELNPMFHFPYCTFGIAHDHESTARGVIHRMTGNQNILTIENSFYGSKIDDKIIGYDPQTIGKLSLSILEGVHNFLSKSSLTKCCQQKIRNNLHEYLLPPKTARQSTNIVRMESGSESDPFCDEISIRDKIRKILPKSFRVIERQLQQYEREKKNKQIVSTKKIVWKKNNNKTMQHAEIAKYGSQSQNLRVKGKSKSVDRNKDKKPKNEQKQHERVNQNTPNYQRNTTLGQTKRFKESSRRSVAILNFVDSGFKNKNKNNSHVEVDKKENSSLLKNDFLAKVSDLELPFYIREKSNLVPLKLKNELMEVEENQNIRKKLMKEQNNNKLSSKKSINKIQMIKEETNLNKLSLSSKMSINKIQMMKEQPNPSKLSSKKNITKIQLTNNQFSDTAVSEIQKLYIFSQEKKKLQYEKNMIKSQKLVDKIANSLPHRITIQNDKMEQNKKNSKIQSNNLCYYSQMKSQTDKIKCRNHRCEAHNNLISKIWRQNFVRYGHDLHVFFGGHKQQ